MVWRCGSAFRRFSPGCAMPIKAPCKNGVWLPWGVVQRLATLRLRPSSCWPALITILTKQYGFGGDVAFITLAELAEATNTSLSTSKRAVAVLIKAGLVRRDRKRRLSVQFKVRTERGTKLTPTEGASQGVNKLTPRKGQHSEPSLICISSVKNTEGRKDLSAKQSKTIESVLKEATQLLGSDASLLALSPEWATRLSLPTSTTYFELIRSAENGGVLARDAVAAVLALKKDTRVQGVEIDLTTPWVKHLLPDTTTFPGTQVEKETSQRVQGKELALTSRSETVK